MEGDATLGGYIGEKETLLVTLEETLRPAHTALLVVDRQKDFVYGRGRRRPPPEIPYPTAIIRNIAAFVDLCRAVGVPVFWIVTRHGRDVDLPCYKARMAREGEPPLCLEGSEGAELIDELVPRPGERIIVKHGYDGFAESDLDICLINRGIRTLIMSGAGTGTCVDATYKHGFHLGYHIVIASDLTQGRNEAVHLEHFRKYYGLLATSREIARIWGASLPG